MTEEARSRITYCRICEAMCGLVATVENGRLSELRPDPENPMSRGYVCPKGIAMTEIQNDPDRVLHPLRRRADGPGFERVSWDEAIADIGRRLSGVLDRGGGESIACYAGVPNSVSFGHSAWTAGFIKAVGSPHYYLATSQDVASRLVADWLLYGSALRLPIPDLARTEFLLILGANPLVSNGSALTAPRIHDRLRAITKRGGDVVVVDPRHTETGKAFEWIGIRPDTDAWLLLAMLNVVFQEGLEDADFLVANVSGLTDLREAALAFTPENTASRTGVPAETCRLLARRFAHAASAVAYCRTGACRGRFPTLVNVLLDALNIVTGNVDRPGGALFAESAIPFLEMGRMTGADNCGTLRTRIGDLPDTLHGMPSNIMAKEITTPGRGQIRALFVSAGNPVSTVPDAQEFETALRRLELLVSIDLYVNDTNRHADYILPATTWLERSETHSPHNYSWVSPFTQYAEAVVPPYGEAKEEWEIVEAISRRIGIVPQGSRLLRALGRLGLRPSPKRIVDLALRLGPYGDRFGLRRNGLSLEGLGRHHPHGFRFLEHHPTGRLRRIVRHKDHRIHLFDDSIKNELVRLREATPPTSDRFPLLLVSLRELRSHNSWTHNSPRLMRNRRFALHVHPDDAAGYLDGDRVRVSSEVGTIDVPLKVTEDMMPGSVALPWGWGHRGGWQVANNAGGANLNLLMSSRIEDIERLSGSTWLNGVPVRIDRAEGQPRSRPA